MEDSNYGEGQSQYRDNFKEIIDGHSGYSEHDSHTLSRLASLDWQ